MLQRASHLNGLKSFDISNCTITHAGIWAELFDSAWMRGLEVLRLKRASITSRVLTIMRRHAGFTMLNKLDLSYNELKNLNTLASTKQFATLEHLDLSGNELDDVSLETLVASRYLPKHMTLDLRHNHALAHLQTLSHRSIRDLRARFKTVLFSDHDL